MSLQNHYRKKYNQCLVYDDKRYNRNIQKEWPYHKGEIPQPQQKWDGGGENFNIVIAAIFTL